MPTGQCDSANQAGGDVMAVVSAVSHGFSLLCGPFSPFLPLFLSIISLLSTQASQALLSFTFLTLPLTFAHFLFSALPLSVYPIPISVPAFSLYSDYLNRLTSLPKQQTYTHLVP